MNPIRYIPRGGALRHAAVSLAALVTVAVVGPASADSGGGALAMTDVYAGVFAGSGRARNRLVDVDGFANWGNPGSMVDYGDNQLVGGALIGRKFEIGGTPLRIELDAVIGSLSASSSALDPTCADESVESELRWITTARLGVEETLGRATVFATGGLAAARIANSVTDIDYRGSCLEMELRHDFDDSFRDESLRFGWVIGAGVDVALDRQWTFRVEGSYLDFGQDTYHVNHSADNTCGRGGRSNAVLLRHREQARSGAPGDHSPVRSRSRGPAGSPPPRAGPSRAGWRWSRVRLVSAPQRRRAGVPPATR